MFRVTADSLKAYLDFDAVRKADLVRLHELVRKAAPGLRRYFHQGTPAGEPGMRLKMIGYGKFRYADPAIGGTALGHAQYSRQFALLWQTYRCGNAANVGACGIH